MGSSRLDFIEAECRETERLKRRAWRLGIEVPNHPTWWADDFAENIEAGVGVDQLEYAGNHWLTEEGKARLSFQIYEAEIRKEDARIERRNKRLAFYAQIVTMIVSLGGVLMGLIALLKR